jgi:nicotinamidase-related amidase
LSPPDANSAFVGRALEGMLDELGPTTLVRCGVLTPNSARHAGAPLYTNAPKLIHRVDHAIVTYLFCVGCE